MANCVYCKANSSSLKYTITDIFEDNYDLVECKVCKTSFLNPFPTSQQLKRAYSDDYYGEGDKKFNSTVEKAVDFFRQRNAKKMAKAFGGKGAVLDVGCGNGSFLVNLSKHGNFDLFGVELPGKSADRAISTQKIKIHLGELKNGLYAENKFDAISFIHVFEHLANPKEILEIVSEIIKPGGSLLIEFPNIDSFQANFFKKNWFHLDPPRHLNFFKPKPFVAELKKFGFTCIHESYQSTQFSPFGVQQSILNSIGIKKDLLYEYLKSNKEYTKSSSKFSLWLQKLFHWFTFPIFIISDILFSTFKKGGTVRFVFKRQ